MWGGRGLLCCGRLGIGSENTSVDAAPLSWEHRFGVCKAEAPPVLLPGFELEALLSKPGLMATSLAGWHSSPWGRPQETLPCTASVTFVCS